MCNKVRFKKLNFRFKNFISLPNKHEYFCFKRTKFVSVWWNVVKLYLHRVYIFICYPYRGKCTWIALYQFNLKFKRCKFTWHYVQKNDSVVVVFSQSRWNSSLHKPNGFHNIFELKLCNRYSDQNIVVIIFVHHKIVRLHKIYVQTYVYTSWYTSLDEKNGLVYILPMQNSY